MSNTYRCDGANPEAIKQAVSSSQTVTGSEIELFGAMAVSVQVTLTGGAAGTLFLDGSNQSTDANRGNTAVFQQGMVSQALTANQAAIFTYSLVDPITSLGRLRPRFTSTAAGNVQVAINVRRMTY